MIFSMMLAIADAPLQPAGKWAVDYQPNMCIGSRIFGDPANPVIFGFEPAPVMGSGGATLLILAPDTQGKAVRQGNATITLQPDAKQSFDYISWENKAGTQRAYEMTVNANFMAKLGQSTGLSLQAGKASFSLATGKVQAVLAAMKTCSDDLMRSWGVDPKSAAEPVGNPASWFSYEDYPAAALRRGSEGRVSVVVTVNAAGRVDACRVVVTSKDPDLDRTTCDIARKDGHFKPKNVPSFAIYSVRWSMYDD